MPDNNKARPLAHVLAKLSTARKEEVQHRVTQGDLPFLPGDVRFEAGRAHFPEIGWIDTPGLNPTELPIDDIEVVFLIQRGETGHSMEVALRTTLSESDTGRRIRKASAFRTKSALDRYLRKAPPVVAKEVVSRLKRGELAFLPDQLVVNDGKVYLRVGEGGYEIPAISPREVTARTIVLVFYIPARDRGLFEIIRRTQ